MTLNWIWWWDICSGNLGSVEYLFIIAITPWFTLAQSGSICYSLIYVRSTRLKIISIT